MGGSYEFVFGTRPWRIWHVAQLLLALPMLWFADYFSSFVPGAGPQGGEVVFMLMLMHALLYLLVALVNAGLVAARISARAIARFVLWPLMLIVVWLIAVALVLLGAELGTAVDSTAGERRLGLAFVVLAVVGNYAANFAALWRVRRG